jgi:hypothetical protein
VKQGTAGIGGVVGGAGLLILRALGAVPVVGWIIGGVLAIGGLAVAASSKEDRTAGAIVGGAGVLTILAGFGLGFGSTLLLLGGIGLLGFGAWGLYKFIKGLRSRR